MSAPAEPRLRMTRRAFVGSMAAGALLIAVGGNGRHAVARVVRQEDDELPFEPSLWVAIAPDGAVRIMAHRSEMGTGIRTALPMVVAEELGAEWDRVTVVQATGDRRLGSQNTDGSRSVRRFYRRMRVAGATARTMLEQAAAAEWSVDAGECRGRAHTVTHIPSGRTIAYGALVADAREIEAPDEARLRFIPKRERRYVGHDVPIVDLDEIVTGHATFGIDVRRPNQLFAVIERAPVLGGQPESVDDGAARAVTGVVDVVELPTFKPPHGFQALGGVAVIADSTWAALEGRRALRIEWSDSPHRSLDSAVQEATLADAARQSGRPVREHGDAVAALSGAPAETIFEADYYVPMLSHAPMEPPCAVAEVTKDASGTVVSCEAWAPTQNPQAAQQQLAAQLSIPMSSVTVHVTLLGGGFGRKSKPDFIVEAALLSRAVDRPVHVTWTREDDIRHDYFHTNAAMHMRAVVGDNGIPSAWLQRSIFPPIMSTFVPGARAGSSLELGMGFTDLPYDVPNLRVESGDAEAHVRIGWLRSVAHIYHAFGTCSFRDELAQRAGRDSFEHLMEVLGAPRNLALDGVEYPNHDEPLDRYPFDVGRLRDVTARAAELAQWGRTMPAGRALGIACHRSFLSYCANVVEVAVDASGAVTIPNVWVVIDAGEVVHPDRVRAQMEGAATFAASLALYGEITAKNGAIEQSNYHDYRMTRIHDAPRNIEVEIVASEELPAGVGEVGVPPFAPALCNAIHAATGVRIRRLPIARHDLSTPA